jgi:hypothetical protein
MYRGYATTYIHNSNNSGANCEFKFCDEPEISHDAVALWEAIRDFLPIPGV